MIDRENMPKKGQQPVKAPPVAAMAPAAMKNQQLPKGKAPPMAAMKKGQQTKVNARPVAKRKKPQQPVEAPPVAAKEKEIPPLPQFSSDSEYASDSSSSEPDDAQNDDGPLYNKKHRLRAAEKLMKLHEGPIRSPRPIAQLVGMADSEILKEGDKFPSKAHFLLTVAELNEAKCRISTTAQASKGYNNKLMVKCCCGESEQCKHAADASFRLSNAMLLDGNAEIGYFKCTNCVPHDCKPSSKQAALGAYSAKQLVPVVIPLLEGYFDCPPKAIVKELAKYLNKEASISTVNRIKVAAREAVYGKSSDEFKLLPAMCEALRRKGHHAELELISKTELLAIVLKVWSDQHTREQKRLNKSETTPFERQKHWELLNEDVLLPDDKMFPIRWAWAPGSSTVCFDALFAWQASDACHTQPPDGFGIIFSSYTASANSSAIMLSQQWSFLHECKSNWKSHLMDLKNWFGAEKWGVSERVIVLDGAKGGWGACKDCVTNANSFQCAIHRAQHHPCPDIYKSAVHARTPSQLKQLTDSMNDKGKKYGERYLDKQQYMFSSAEHGACLHDKPNSNFAEVMNGAMSKKGTRRMHPPG